MAGGQDEVLNSDDINQLNSLQVITNSRNEKLADSKEAGTRTWFVIAICEEDGRTIKKLPNGQSLSWLSHSNWFKNVNNGNGWVCRHLMSSKRKYLLTYDYLQCRGRMFTKDDEIFKHLKSKDVISVWMSAGTNHKNHADSGYLVFGFGNGPETYQTPKVRQQANNAPLISVYAQERQECLMIPVDGSSTEVKANTVHGGVDLMHRLLEKHDNDWRVERYSLGPFNQAAPELAGNPPPPNFDSVIELAKGKKGETPSLRVVRHSTIKKKGGSGSTDNNMPPANIVVWDDSEVSKEVEVQDPNPQVLIYQMHAPLWSGTLWDKVRPKIIAGRLAALRGTGEPATREWRDIQQDLKVLEQQASAEAERQALADLERQASTEAEEEIRTEARLKTLQESEEEILAETDLEALEKANLEFLTDTELKPRIKTRLEALKNGQLEALTTTKLEALTALAQRDLSTIIVIDADDFRADGIRISRGISWEKTMEDCKDNIGKIYAKMKIGLGRQAAHVTRLDVHLLVRFGYEGVLHLRPVRDGEGSNGPLFVFHMVPNMAEGDLLRPYRGRMSGIHLAFVTGLAACLARQPEGHLLGMGRTQIGLAIELAIVWSHRFATTGFCKDAEGRLNYPKAKDINNYKIPKTKVIYGDQKMVKKPKGWSLFSLLEEARQGVAAEVVKLGTERLEASVPTAKFGFVQTADRTEIEGYRSTAAVIHEYLNNKVKKPLSIAVFGQPGAGKSFGVKEVIKALLNHDKDWEPIEANLSQFLHYSDLVRVFDKVRDTALAGETPVVLFDEFDSGFDGKDLGWLKYFLAPMQDGQFLDSGFVRPLGRAIFIFIGGTSSTFSEFKYGTEVTPADLEAAKQYARDKAAAEEEAVRASSNGRGSENDAFKATTEATKATEATKTAEKNVRDLAAKLLTNDDKKAKKPDFVSRLSAHINVKGPNKSDDGDKMFVMRRAMLLQGQLRKHFKADPKEIHVDDTVLNALLNHKEFPNGTRSIELILQSSRLSGGRRFESSDLPSDEQLSMHVGGVKAFHELVDKPIAVEDVRPVDIDLYNKLMWAKLKKVID
ncbi:hypothetical protein NCS52_01298400 [Fusarium sp. LHS14.1]|nr:hypothetical protein NCS52_01298400 [Fusarium sp. LHS14.1]